MKGIAVALGAAFVLSTVGIAVGQVSPVSGSLTCGVGYVCMIELPTGTVIQGDPFMFGGCKTGSTRTQGCLWQLAWSGPSVKSPIIVVTPNYDALKTNIVIATDQATYNVDLRSDTHSGRAMVSFAPSVTAVASPAAVATDPPVPTEREVLQVARAANPEPAWSLWYPDYCGTATNGHPDFKPLFVATDGHRTFVAMPFLMQATPSVYALIGTDRTIVQPSKQGRMWIFDGSPDEFELVVADQRVLEQKGKRC